MKTLLRYLLFFSVAYVSCSSNSPKDETFKEETNVLFPCPLDSCQKVSIELSMPGYSYSAPFTCYEWTDWGTGLKVDWTDNGRTLFFTFPNHRICKPQFRICAEEICNCDLPAVEAGWQPIEDCPRNNTITFYLDSCLQMQTTLFLETYLIDNE